MPGLESLCDFLGPAGGGSCLSLDFVEFLFHMPGGFCEVAERVGETNQNVMEFGNGSAHDSLGKQVVSETIVRKCCPNVSAPRLISLKRLSFCGAGHTVRDRR